MIFRHSYLGSAAMATALMLGGCVTQDTFEQLQAEKNQEISGLQRERAALDQQLQELRAQRAALEGQRNSLAQQKSSLEQDKAALERE
jgi:predicted  nucleic acid-binding Zn-ribbon protein